VIEKQTIKTIIIKARKIILFRNEIWRTVHGSTRQSRHLLVERKDNVQH